MQTPADALDALKRAWPRFVGECRSVLGSELHYQALLYHCLRTHGEVPSRQLGMNVKMWITDVVSDLFRKLDEKKHPDYRGGFEPIPEHRDLPTRDRRRLAAPEPGQHPEAGA